MYKNDCKWRRYKNVPNIIIFCTKVKKYTTAYLQLVLIFLILTTF